LPKTKVIEVKAEMKHSHPDHGQPAQGIHGLESAGKSGGVFADHHLTIPDRHQQFTA
jgi:hypothetical protein